MSKDVVVVDDEEAIIRRKEQLLRDAGFNVSAFQYARFAIMHLLEQPVPYAVVTDTDMPDITGPDLVVYLSPKANREDKYIEQSSGKVCLSAFNIALRGRFQDFVGKYNGKIVLTSRQDLRQRSIDNAPTEQARREIVTLNGALRISDGVYKIDADGTGIDKLIEYLTAD